MSLRPSYEATWAESRGVGGGRDGGDGGVGGHRDGGGGGVGRDSRDGGMFPP